MTETVMLLPACLYICVSEHGILNVSGKSCRRKHSRGVSFLMWFCLNDTMLSVWCVVIELAKSSSLTSSRFDLSSLSFLSLGQVLNAAPFVSIQGCLHPPCPVSSAGDIPSLSYTDPAWCLFSSLSNIPYSLLGPALELMY